VIFISPNISPHLSPRSQNPKFFEFRENLLQLVQFFLPFLSSKGIYFAESPHTTRII
jgi:hypothetical protein